MINNFTASRLARLAYHALVENAYRIQKEVALQEAIDKRFGDDALPVNDLMRRGYQDVLRNDNRRTLASMMNMHAEYIAAIREFEKLFEIEEKENMEAFAREFAARMRDEGSK